MSYIDHWIFHSLRQELCGAIRAINIGRYMAGWLVAWLAGWFRCWQVLVAGRFWLPGWKVDRLSGWRVGWLELAGWMDG